jgi:xylan 1,4-beta-xylosidase
VKRALPTARVGGPHSTGPGSERAAKFLRDFLEHVVRGKNYATGQTGSPIDYVGFHAKGSPKVVEGHVQMGISNQLRSVARGFEIVASFPELKSLPIIIGESDPEGCAACSVRFHPQNGYRNGTMYSSYTAASFARKHDLAARHQVNFEGAVTWAFEFEDQPYFDGFRDLATNGVGKPVLNVFRMFGLMGGQRVAVQSSGAADLETILKDGVRDKADVSALASQQDQSVDVMVWNYHDDDLPGAMAAVKLSVEGLPSNRVRVSHYRVDKENSNSYEVWKQMGSPQSPSPQQYAQLEKASELQLLKSPEWFHAPQGRLTLNFDLPRQGVSLLKFDW